MNTGEPAVEVEGLRFAYGMAPPVLDGVAFTLAAGEIFGIVGADGAGKSTLLRLLIGQLGPAAGSIRVLGRDARDPALREQVAYMPQGFGQYLDLSVQENLRFFAAMHGLAPAAAVPLIADLVERAGLKGFEDRRAGQLSGGMMQKLALACALVSRPRAIFLDEPTTGVDPLSRRAFWRLLEDVRAAGVAIVCTTANMDEAERCDRIGMLEGGRLRRVGPPAELAGADALLCAVSGPLARQSLALLRAMPAVALAFPVGRQVSVWLRPGQRFEDFVGALRMALPALAAAPVVPRLREVALRELALSAGPEPRRG